MARDILKTGQKNMKKSYDLRLYKHQYSEASLVYVLDTAVKVGECAKLVPPWKGPGVVTEVITPYLYKVRLRDKYTVFNHALSSRIFRQCIVSDPCQIPFDKSGSLAHSLKSTTPPPSSETLFVCIGEVVPPVGALVLSLGLQGFGTVLRSRRCLESNLSWVLQVFDFQPVTEFSELRSLSESTLLGSEALCRDFLLRRLRVSPLHTTCLNRKCQLELLLGINMDDPVETIKKKKKKSHIGVGASLSALAVATLVWEAGERKPTRLLVATLVWEPRAGGKGGDPPFSDDDPERTRNETA